MTGRPILVSGWRGFLGTNLRRALAQADHRLALFPADISDAGAWDRSIGGGEVVFHLAARARGSAQDVESVAIQGARGLAETATATGGVRVVFASSRWAVEHPETVYGRSKAAVEAILGEAVAGKNGCSVAIVRLPNLYGPMCRPFLYSVVATFCWLRSHGRSDLPLSETASETSPYLGVGAAVDSLMAEINDDAPLRIVDLSGAERSAVEWARLVTLPVNREEDPDLQDCMSFFEELPASVRHVADWADSGVDSVGEVLRITPGGKLIAPASRQDRILAWRAGEGICDVYTADGWYGAALDVSVRRGGAWWIQAGHGLELRAPFMVGLEVEIRGGV